MIETKKRQQTSPAHIVCIEVKMSENWNNKWEQTMRSLKNSNKIVVEKIFGIYMGSRTYHFDGVDVLPLSEFFKQLYKGEIF